MNVCQQFTHSVVSLVNKINKKKPSHKYKYISNSNACIRHKYPKHEGKLNRLHLGPCPK
jgi:hypothetical protein